MRPKFTILILFTCLPVWVACESAPRGAGMTLPTSPALENQALPATSVSAPRATPMLAASRASLIIAAASSLPATDICSEVPQGSSDGRVRYFCDCADGADADCQPGNDAASGRAEAPARSYEAARTSFGNMRAGDTIAFCRGGSFRPGRESRWNNARCQAGRRCVVRDYLPAWASGDEGAPIIRVQSGGRAFSLDDKGRSSHEEGYTFMNLDLQSTDGDRGFFFYNDIDDVDICNVSIDHFKIGVHVAGSNAKRDVGSDGKNDRIVLKHARITNSPGQGWLGSCDDCAIENSYFENNGFDKPKFNHNIYLSGSNKAAAKGMRVVGNELYQSAVLNGKCEGVSLVAHGEKDGLLIENNLIREDIGAVGRGCWGIAVDTGYGSHEAFRNIVIRNNRIINVGPVSIGLNSCSHCLIENNVIVQEQPLNGRHIATPNRKRAQDDLPMTHVTIRNNSIYVGPDSGGIGIKLAEEGTGHRVVSNAIFYAGTKRWSCLDVSLPASSYEAVGHNVCDAPNLSGFDWEMKGGSLSDWRTKTSLGAGSQQSDPGFKSMQSSHDLSAASANSAMVGAGDATHSSGSDTAGNKRGATPDAGAYQH